MYLLIEYKKVLLIATKYFQPILGSRTSHQSLVFFGIASKSDFRNRQKDIPGSRTLAALYQVITHVNYLGVNISLFGCSIFREVSELYSRIFWLGFYLFPLSGIHLSLIFVYSKGMNFKDIKLLKVHLLHVHLYLPEILLNISFFNILLIKC